MDTCLFSPRQQLKLIPLLKLVPRMTFHHTTPSHFLFPPDLYPSTQVGDVVSNFFSFNIKSLQYLLEELTLPRSACCALSFTLQRAQHSFCYIPPRIGRAKTSSCSNCNSESQDIFHLLLECPAFDSLRLAIFSHSLAILDLRSRPLKVSRLLGLKGVDSRPHP